MGLFDTVLASFNNGAGLLNAGTSGTRLFSNSVSSNSAPSNNNGNTGYKIPWGLSPEEWKALSYADAYKFAFKENPWGVSLGLGKGLFDTGSSIWNAFQNYKSYKDQLALSRDMYNLKKQEYENNEARNQQQFDWWKQARATSQL